MKKPAALTLLFGFLLGAFVVFPSFFRLIPFKCNGLDCEPLALNVGLLVASLFLCAAVIAPLRRLRVFQGFVLLSYATLVMFLGYEALLVFDATASMQLQQIALGLVYLLLGVSFFLCFVRSTT
jgi:hypothetical protein